MYKDFTLDQLYDLVIDKLIYECVNMYTQHVSRTIYAGSPFLHSPDCCISLCISIYDGKYEDPKHCVIAWCKKRYGTRRVNRMLINEYHTYC